MTDLYPAFKVLLPPQFTVFDGVVAKGDGTPYGPDELPRPPWLFVRFPVPDVLGRAITGDIHGQVIEGEILCYHSDPSGSRALAQAVAAVLDGARPVLAGWQFGRVTIDDITGPGQDRDVKFVGGFHPQVTSIDFTFVASKEAQ